MNIGDISRRKDYIYRLLAVQGAPELSDCTKSILKTYVEKHAGCHPTLASMAAKVDAADNTKVVLKRALVLFCMYAEPSFVQYLMDRTDVSDPCVSLFVCDFLPLHVRQLLDGTVALEDFVTNATCDYICG